MKSLLTSVSSCAVIAFGLGTGAMAQQSVPPLTYGVGLQPDGSVLVPSNQVLTPAGTQVELPLSRPNTVAIRPDQKTAAVLTKPDNSSPIRVIDLENGTELQEYVPPDKLTNGSYAGIIYSADGQTLYASQDSGNIQVADVDRNGLLTFNRQIPIPQPVKGAIPGTLALSADGKLLYVVLNALNTLGIIDLSTSTLIKQIPVGNSPRDIVVLGDVAYVSNEGGRVAGPGDFTLNGRDNGAILLGPEGNVFAGPVGTVQSTDIFTPIVADPVTGAATTGTVSVVDLRAGRTIRNIAVGLHPTGLAAANGFVFVANTNSDSISIIDTKSKRVVKTEHVKPFEGAPFGSSPNALAFGLGRRLFVSFGTNNAVGVYRFSSDQRDEADRSSDSDRSDRLDLTMLGMIPTGWFPGNIVIDQPRRQLVVANVKGIGSLGPVTTSKDLTGRSVFAETGTISLIPLPNQGQLQTYTEAVLKNNYVSPHPEAVPDPHAVPRALPLVAGEPSLIKHVFLIIKENRTYDQILGDVGRGNGDAGLAIFGKAVTPNHHALSLRFPLFDNLYSSGLQSADGHQWVTQAMAPDYVERNGQDASRSYPYNGGDPLAAGGGGFLWDDAVEHGVSVRVYGEYSDIVTFAPGTTFGSWSDYYNDSQILEGKRQGHLSRPIKQRQQSTQFPRLNSLLNHDYPGFDGGVPDQYRADIFLREFDQYVRQNNLPQLVLIALTADHTTGTGPGFPTPTAAVADNDLALGRIVEAISQSPYWRDSAIFVEEDDSQNGVDHVDGHRQPAFVISPYARQDGMVDSTFYTQINIDRTIQQILGLPPMNQFDRAAAPMFTAFTDTPNFAPFRSLAATYPITELNPGKRAATKLERDWSKASVQLVKGHEHEPDQQDENMMNHLVWYSATGFKKPYPGENAVLRPSKVQHHVRAAKVDRD